MSDFRKSLHNGTHKKIEWEEDLNYLFEEIKNLYKVEAKDEYGNVIIDEETKKPKLVDSLRRSGKPKYTHPYNVAQYLYNIGYSREYVITALFHDVLEDTKYKEEDIRRILGEYWEQFFRANKKEDKEKENKEKEEFVTKIINAVNCVTKKGKISRPKAPILKLKNKIKIGNIEIEEVTVHELLEKKNISMNIGEFIKRIHLDYLNKKSLKEILKYNSQEELNQYLEDFNEILTDESQKELKQYIEDLKDYYEKMPEYIKGIKESENDIAKIVKIADRISNLADFSPTDNSNWLEKYISETVDFFLDLASEIKLKSSEKLEEEKLEENRLKRLKRDFMNAIRNAILTKNVKKHHENGDKGELIIRD